MSVFVKFETPKELSDKAYSLAEAAKDSGKVKKGGAWYQNRDACKPESRNAEGASTQWHNNGFRVMCPVEVP